MNERGRSLAVMGAEVLVSEQAIDRVAPVGVDQRPDPGRERLANLSSFGDLGLLLRRQHVVGADHASDHRLEHPALGRFADEPLDGARLLA